MKYNPAPFVEIVPNSNRHGTERGGAFDLSTRSMRTTYKILFILVAMTFSKNVIRAQISDVEIHCVPKKVDASANQNSGSGSIMRAKERWSYDVTIENKTFKDLSGLEMKYVIFFKQEKLAVKDAATTKRQSGSITIGLLKPHEKKSVTTNSVELDKTQLVGNYYYPDGGRQKAQDTLGGLWVRVYQNGQQLAEYANPSTLMKEHWQ